MTSARTETIAGTTGTLHVATWEPSEPPRCLAVLVHGYGEHLGRYEHVAAHLTAHGAVVTGPDHLGHGRSDGERVLIADLEDVVADLGRVVALARERHPDLPLVMIGHSMGGLIAARYAQQAGEDLTALVLSGPVLGRWEAAELLLAAPEIPEVPIDPDTLSRDPAVGAAYVADPLVWHGTFRRETLEALVAALAKVTESGPVASLPVLWIHGEDDQLVPVGPTRDGVAALVPAEQLTADVRAGARHEVLNETDREAVLAEITTFLAAQLP